MCVCAQGMHLMCRTAQDMCQTCMHRTRCACTTRVREMCTRCVCICRDTRGRGGVAGSVRTATRGCVSHKRVCEQKHARQRVFNVYTSILPLTSVASFLRAGTLFDQCVDQIWTNFRPNLDQFRPISGPILDQFGPILDQIWTNIFPFLETDQYWTKFGPIFAKFGPILAKFGPIFGRLESTLDIFVTPQNECTDIALRHSSLNSGYGNAKPVSGAHRHPSGRSP